MNLQRGNIAGKTRIKPLLVIFAYNILFMAASGLLVPGTPLYLSTNGFDGGSVNLLLSSIAVSSLIGQVTWGYLSDRAMDRLFFLKLGTAGYALGYLAIVLLKNRLALAILLVATSFVGSASYPAAMALLSETSSTKNRGRSMGVFWSAASLGWAISVAFTGFIINELGGGYFFGLCSLLYSASLALVHLFLRIEDRHASDDKRSRGVSLSSFFRLGTPFLAFLSGSIIFFMADFAKNVYVPMFYAFELGLGMVTATLLLSLTSWLEIPVNVIFGYLSDRLGRKTVVLVAYVLCGAYMFINSMVTGFEGALLTMALYGFVWGAFSGASSAFASELVDEDKKGIALGLFNSSWNIASMLAPVSIGMLSQAYGYRLMFNTMGVLMLLACLIIIFGIQGRA
ncbi:MAG: MFS transporter [Candidatus Brockarchaeota archaeon]|nr:MFS transporter [Candidatus Brockarchaeota archaeon]MBO3808039.1 MFS transporter [Candidatus Brockarchaeota archaeon]